MYTYTQIYTRTDTLYIYIYIYIYIALLLSAVSCRFVQASNKGCFLPFPLGGRQHTVTCVNAHIVAHFQLCIFA